MEPQRKEIFSTSYQKKKKTVDYHNRNSPERVTYLNSPANPSDRRTFSVGTKRGGILQISYLNIECFPVVTSAVMILDCGKQHPRRRSITKLMRKNVALRSAVENEVLAYIELVNESLAAEAYSERIFSQMEIN